MLLRLLFYTFKKENYLKCVINITVNKTIFTNEDFIIISDFSTFFNYYYSLIFIYFLFYSPGVIITELQRRGGMTNDVYKNVN